MLLPSHFAGCYFHRIYGGDDLHDAADHGEGDCGETSVGNLTTNVSVGTGVIDATNSRCYLPSQSASGNTFSLAGWYEVI